ncbi:hypothetical protein FSARC_521 [Fusarium sarcochroum]|uniref:Uncharacterized protein n=1 Tax=Fusarium sarcochroum TaxID=1208366 RepID=A0A8H4UBE5_9HYPO|nr:hypothetical protein FSARC_521 [Fusarium sarcochroum]
MAVQLQLEDDGAPSFAPTVISILNSAFMQEIPPSEAATALDSLFDQTYREHGNAADFLWWFWDLVHDLARQIPHDSLAQDRLTSIIRELQALPEKTVDLGKGWGEDSSVQNWTNLPLFGPTFREKLDEATGTVQRQKRMVNLQAYAARLGGYRLIPIEVYAIWAFVDALEGTMTPIRGRPDEVNSDPMAIEDVAYKVKCAAIWMIHAGHVLHGRDEEIQGATAGPLWKLDKKEGIQLRRKTKGTDGLCDERWKLWQERFDLIRGLNELETEARELAGEAWAVMNAV